MAKGKKRGHDGGHENHERWLLTYADMITLLVAFFIMLYAMSVMNVTKFQQLSLSVRAGFGSSMTNGTPTIMKQGGGVNGSPSIVQNGQTKENQQNDNGKAQAQAVADWDIPNHKLKSGEEDKRFWDLKVAVSKIVKDEKLDGKVQIIINERGIVIRILTDKMLFESGSADLRNQEVGLLDRVANIINHKLDNQIDVEGHTDNLPIHTARYPSNWDLSAARASVILRYLVHAGVSQERLRASGYADQRPVALNDTVDGRRRNRRVDIVILRKFNPESEVASSGDTGAG